MKKKSITMEEIARYANVSTMTVFRTINTPEVVKKETLNKIVDAMNVLGYKINLKSKIEKRKNKNNLCYTVGVCLCGFQNVFETESLYFFEIMKGIEEGAKINGYNIILHYLMQEHERTTHKDQLLKDGLIDGLIVVSPNYFDSTLENLQNKGYNLVTVSGYTESGQIDFVDGNNLEGIKMGVEHLVNEGHTRIAFIGGKSIYSNAIDRFEGFKEALKNFNIPFVEEYVIEGDFLYETAMRSTNRLFKLKIPPTAIVAASDTMAIAAIQTIKELGMKVPEDISVIGFDDIYPDMNPALTTIHQPLNEMGKRAFEILLNKINDNSNKQVVQEFIPMNLIIRESSGKNNKS